MPLIGDTRLAPTMLILIYALNPGARSEANEKQKPGILQYPGGSDASRADRYARL